MSSIHPIQVVAVTGGKGGVGKTSVSVNLSLALAGLDRRVVLLDADLGLANVDVQLGIRADRTIADVLDGHCDLKDVLIKVDNGLSIIPAASGVQSLVQMGPREHVGIISAFGALADEMDVLVIDSAAGISEHVISFVRAAQEILLVVCDEPSSMTDAYALIKVLNRDCQKRDFRVVANMTRSADEGPRLFSKFSRVAERFLDVNLHYAGNIPQDDMVRKATQRQRAVVQAYPGCPASRAFQSLARTVIEWPVGKQASGHLEFFVERLVQPA